MNKFYIQDTTVGKYVIFDTVPQVVRYLEGMIPRAFKISKEAYIQNLLDLGYGYDDRGGVMLTRVMGEQFNIGVVKDNNYVRTDIHTAAAFQKEEFGSDAVNRFEDRGR
jgi:hypothetical protein